MFLSLFLLIFVNCLLLLLSFLFENHQLTNWKERFSYFYLVLGIKLISCVNLIILILPNFIFKTSIISIYGVWYVHCSIISLVPLLIFFFKKNWLIMKYLSFDKNVLINQIKELFLRLTIYLPLVYFAWNYRFQYLIILYCFTFPEIPFILLMALIYFQPNYDKIIIFKLDVSSVSVVEIWLEIIRIRAFKRLYFILMRKSNPGIILSSLLIYFFSIPIRIGEFLFSLLKMPLLRPFRDRIEIIYCREYESVKNLKIEIIDGIIELNCVSLAKLSTKLLLNKMEKQKAFNVLIDLKRASINFSLFEKERDSIKLKLADIKTRDNGGYLQRRHYVYEEKGNTIHPTSNRPKIILNNQKVEIFMSSAVKLNSKDPQTIVSTQVGKIEFFEKYVVVSPFELNYIKYRNSHVFDLDITEAKYLQQKIAVYNDIITINLNDQHLIWKSLETVVSELTMNHYTQVLYESTNKNFVDLIERRI